MKWDTPGHVASANGVSTTYLRRAVMNGSLPQGLYRATHGGQFRYDMDGVCSWFEENAKRFTRVSRMEMQR